MRKLILCGAAVAALATTGGVWAQSADCARGMFGSDPCGASGVVVPNPNYGDPYAYREWAYRNSSRWNGVQPYPYENWEPRHSRHRGDRDRPHVRNDRDRDGDGVRNNRDRHPNDPRRR